MSGLTQETEAWGFRRLRQEVDALFDRFFEREEMVPSGVAELVRSLQRDLDKLLTDFGDFFDAGQPAMGGSWPAASSWPRFESLVADGEYVIRGELPGFAPEDIEVNVSDWSGKSRRVDSPFLWTGDTLTVRGELKSDHRDLDQLFGSGWTEVDDKRAGQTPAEQENPRWFSRTFILPEPVEPYKVKATFTSALLEVRMPASAKLVGRRIPVRTVEGETSRQLQAA